MLKKSNVSKIFSLMTVILIMVSMMLPMTVFADTITPVSANTTGARKVGFSDANITASNLLDKMQGGHSEDYVNGNITFTIGGTLSVKTKGQTYSLLTLVDQSTVFIDPSAFKNAKNTDVTKAMRIFTDAIKDVGADDDTVQQLMTDIQDVDSTVSTIMFPIIFQETRGDIYAAYKIAEPFLNILSVVLGVGAVLLILLLLFSTVMDMAYIGLPVWREAQANKEGGSHKQPFGVSYEALLTVQEIEKGIGGGDGGYKNAYLLYFKRRALTYIILAICIMYLICGGLSGIIGFVLQLVSGITG